MEQISPKRIFPIKNRKSEHHHWILHSRIRLGAIFLGAMAVLDQTRESGPSMALLATWKIRKWKCYGTSRPSKRELTVYGTSGPRGFSKNAMALLGQVRESWPSMAPLGHVELTKMQKLLKSKNKNQNENSILFSFSFLFSFCFSFSFLFLFLIFVLFCFHFRFCFHFHFHFCFCFRFGFGFCICFRFFFYVSVFIFKFYYGTSRPPYWSLT